MFLHLLMFSDFTCRARLPPHPPFKFKLARIKWSYNLNSPGSYLFKRIVHFIRFLDSILLCFLKQWLFSFLGISVRGQWPISFLCFWVICNTGSRLLEMVVYFACKYGWFWLIYESIFLDFGFWNRTKVET